MIIIFSVNSELVVSIPICNYRRSSELIEIGKLKLLPLKNYTRAKIKNMVFLVRYIETIGQ
jgi:hypothetical protein